MAEVYKFFNSAPGDEREYYASDFANYFSSVLSAGLLLDENEEYGLQVTLDSGLNVKVAIGKALIKGYSYANTTDLTLTHTLPETEYDRIDRIVLRLDLRNANRYIRAFVKTGAASENPVAPDLQRDQYIYELSLAQVRLRANTASIEASDIIDERALENLCGIVQSLITVPISVFQQQFDAWFNNQKTVYETEIVNWQNQEKADFEAWVESLHNILDGDVATNLASRITTLEQEFAEHQAEYAQHIADLISHGVYGTATGANTLAMTISNVSGYVEGMLVAFKNTTTNTGAVTININSLGAKSIKKANGNALSSGNLKAGGIYQLRYDGSSFILLGEGGEYGTATASDVLSGKTFGTENGLVNGTYIPNSIKSVQRGVISTSYGTKEYSATISAVDTTKSIVLIQRPNGNYLYDKPSPSFTNNTTVKFTFDSVNNSGGNLYYTIIEFTNVKSMQSGTIVVTGGALATASFTSVTMSKALLIAYFYNSDNSNGDAFGYCYSVLKTSTSADFYAKYTAWVKWVLIEFT